MSKNDRTRRKKQVETGPKAKFKELLPYLFERRGLFAIITVLSILGAITALIQPLLVGQVIQRVGEEAPLGSLVLLLIIFVLLSAFFNSFQHYLLQRMGEGVVLSSRKKLIAKILRLPISEFDHRRTGDLVSRVGSDTTLLRAALTQGLVEIIGGALLFVGALIAMLFIDPWLFLVTFGVLLLATVAVVILASKIRPAVQQSQEKVGDLAAGVDRAVSAIRTVRAASATEREETKLVENATAAYNLGLKVARISALIVPVSFVALQVSLLSVLGFGGYRVASGAITIAQLVMFIIFLFMLLSPLGQAFGAITSTNQALGALGRINEITSLATESDSDTEIATKVASENEIQNERDDFKGITLQNVEFGYSTQDGQKTPVLRGINFEIESGSRVALVGPSGAGKSTVLALLERFYDPDSGSISLDGKDIRSMSRETLRSRIGYVEQDAQVLAGSIRENLKLTAPNASDEECLKVLRQVNLEGILEREGSSGLETEVGEHGVTLSGGEKQRLAIARALLQAPEILLLDESTASLDSVNERLMREALDSVATGRTLLVIAHRLSTVIDSDLIIVLENGEIKGSGTHEELLNTTPLYLELAKHQLLAD